MSDETSPAETAPARAGRPGTLVAAVAVALLEAAAVIVYTAGIAIAGIQTPGSVAAAPVEVVIYLVLAGGIVVCAVALWRRRAAARTPFGVVQLFGLVVGWTLTQGDGELVHAAGYAVLGVCVLGIALVLSPSLGVALDS